MADTPDGLHELEYARQILEEVLGWPAKGNLELMGDCLRSISKAKRITVCQAHKYMVRAIKLAKQQDIAVDHFFFQSGGYTEVRPQAKGNGIPYFKRETAEEKRALAAEQASPEFQAILQEANEKFKQLVGKALMK